MDQVCDATLKRTFLSLLSHNALVDLVLALDAGTATAVFPADLQAEVKRLQAASESANGADPDADGEGSPDPQPAPVQVSRAPSVPPAGGPRTRAGAARAYAAALATSKDAASGRPSPAPGGISFPSVSTPEQGTSAFAPVPQPYPSLVVHLPGASPPAPAPATPLTPAPVTGPPPIPEWQSPVDEPTVNGSTGPIRNTPGKKTRTGVVGGFNPITSIGPSNEGLPSYEEMIVLALMENQNGEGSAPKDVFAWMSARWPLNANFRPSASQALQKAYKRGRLEKVGTKYKLNPNWHGGATTNRTTRRPQSMAELPGNYAWAPPPVAPIQSVPPDPRVRGPTPPRSSQPPQPQPQAAQPAHPVPNAPSGSGPDFDAQAQVASLLRALQDHNHTGEQPAQANNTRGQTEQPGAQEARGQALQFPHLSMPSASAGPSGAAPNPDALPPPPVPPAGTAPLQASTIAPGPGTTPTAPGMLPVPVPVPVPVPGAVPYPGYHAPTPLQASLATLASQLANMSKANQGT
ncbi:hypothetical protein FRC06_000793 [Ceratobasidium sp. 370]|nr:hypothetical protein FRC06_000793 [Ceratobasidium sp. 370]